ncbi:MAG: peptidoglycan editing factor PgeF [bacterium]
MEGSACCQGKTRRKVPALKEGSDFDVRITLSQEKKCLFKQQGTIGYFTCPDLDGRVIHGFSTKIPPTGGNSKPDEIYRQGQRFCNALRTNVPFMVRLRQVHGDRIFIAKEPVPDPGEYDGVVTDSTEAALSIVTADCLPILIFEQSKKIIGAVHAGWRGASLGILQNALKAIRQNFGARPQDCLLLFGPYLKPCCFEIRDDVLGILKERLPFWPQVVSKVQGRWYFDLQLTNILQAREMGVLQENIWTLDLCTSCQPAWFHSYRRDKDLAGRMISVISLR